MKKYVVYREVTAIYGTIVEADSEEDAYELVDDENNKTDSENPERKWIKVNRNGSYWRHIKLWIWWRFHYEYKYR
mgnify:CR=1 FL=1